MKETDIIIQQEREIRGDFEKLLECNFWLDKYGAHLNHLTYPIIDEKIKLVQTMVYKIVGIGGKYKGGINLFSSNNKTSSSSTKLNIGNCISDKPPNVDLILQTKPHILDLGEVNRLINIVQITINDILLEGEGGFAYKIYRKPNIEIELDFNNPQNGDEYYSIIVCNNPDTEQNIQLFDGFVEIDTIASLNISFPGNLNKP